MYLEKSDVFGFGSLLLNLLMGNRYGGIEFFEHYTPSYIRNHLMNEVVDPTILEEAEAGVVQYHHQLQVVYQLGLECRRDNEEERPIMLDVAKQLTQIQRYTPILIISFLYFKHVCVFWKRIH